MHRSPVRVGETRFPRASDAALRFEAAGALRGRITLEDMLGHHEPLEGRWTLFRTWEGLLAGAAVVTREPNSLYIEYLTRNAAVELPPRLKVGRPLLRAVDEIAEELSVPFLTLDSVDDPGTITFYRRAGFEAAGPAHRDGVWGILHPRARPVGTPP